MSAPYVVVCSKCRARCEVRGPGSAKCPKCQEPLPAPVAPPGAWGADAPPPRANPLPLPEPAAGPEPAYRAAPPTGGARGGLVVLGVLLLAGGIGTAVVLATRSGKPVAEPDVARSAPPEPAPRPAPEPPRPAPKAIAPVAPKGPVPKVPDRPASKEYVKLLTAPPPVAELSGDEVFRKLLPSSTLVIAGDGHGSGVLVDAEKRLMVTNAHVVEDDRFVTVYFPARDAEDNPQPDPQFYTERKAALAIRGEVLTKSKLQDLALVRLDKVPADARPAQLAPKPAAAGSKVYSIGNSGLSERAMWRLTDGTVRGRSVQKYTDGAGRREYTVLETTAPFNPGDSGGPVANGRGEVVALVAAFDRRARSVSLNVDLVEVRELIEGHFRARGETWKEPEPPAPPAPPAATFDNLLAVLKGGAPADRPVAARRLGELRGAAKAAVPALLAALDGADAELQTAVATALVLIGAPEPGGERALVAALRSPSADARQYAARALATGPVAPEDAVPELVSALADPSADVRSAVALALGNMGPKARPGALGALLDRTGDGNPLVRAAAERAVRALGPPAAEDRAVLLERLKGGDQRVRLSAFVVLRALGVTRAEAREFWVPLLAHTDPQARRAAVEALGAPELAAGFADELLPLLADAEPEVRVAAARAAGRAATGRAADQIGRAHV